MGHVPHVLRRVTRVSQRVTSRRPAVNDARVLRVMPARDLARDVPVRVSRAVTTGDLGQQPNVVPPTTLARAKPPSDPVVAPAEAPDRAVTIRAEVDHHTTRRNGSSSSSASDARSTGPCAPAVLPPPPGIAWTVVAVAPRVSAWAAPNSVTAHMIDCGREL